MQPLKSTVIKLAQHGATGTGIVSFCLLIHNAPLDLDPFSGIQIRICSFFDLGENASEIKRCRSLAQLHDLHRLTEMEPLVSMGLDRKGINRIVILFDKSYLIKNHERRTPQRQ